MKKILEIVDGHIKKFRSEFYSSLNTSLDEEDIQRIENQYNSDSGDLKMLVD